MSTAPARAPAIIEALAARYLQQRKLADAAFMVGDGAAQTGHALAASLALRAYAEHFAISTDEAAAQIRKEARA